MWNSRRMTYYCPVWRPQATLWTPGLPHLKRLLAAACSEYYLTHSKLNA
jgi:hypothetical protein